MEKHRIILTREQIQARIPELAREISTDYMGRDVVFVCVLKGAAYFFVDLTRAVRDINELKSLSLVFMRTETCDEERNFGAVVIIDDIPKEQIESRDVIIVEDIADRGLTLVTLLEHLGKKDPASLAIAVALSKPDKHQHNLQLKYVGFEREGLGFLSGYGLDPDRAARDIVEIV